MVEYDRVRETRDIQSHPRRPARWIWLLSVALLFVVGAVSYALLRRDTTTVANPPAVLATPATSPNVPAPAPQTTTGNAVNR